MLEFILERYNYWIVIILMLTGLYIVFSRGNLVKKIIGLNIFQTSVFIFYITIGKIAGGTAPILVGGHGVESHGSDGKNHGQNSAHETSLEPRDAHDAGSHQNDPDQTEVLTDLTEANESLHGKIANQFPDEINANELSDLVISDAEALVTDKALPAENLHVIEENLGDKISNSVLADAKAALAANDELQLRVETGTEEIAGTLADALSAEGLEEHSIDQAHAGDPLHHGAEGLADVIYTNPLPHVLILTAIVVGVATTAVGLALAVRIREAYGTIEEDELEAADDIAEFGARGSYAGAQDLVAGSA